MDANPLAKFTVIQTPFRSDLTVDVVSVNFDLKELSILVASDCWAATVIFEQTYGFRVLDEGDLSANWSLVTLADGWIFKVDSGGWKSLELTRPDFVSGYAPAVEEYLIIGRNECVSVLSKATLSINDVSNSFMRYTEDGTSVYGLLPTCTHFSALVFGSTAYVYPAFELGTIARAIMDYSRVRSLLLSRAMSTWTFAGFSDAGSTCSPSLLHAAQS